MRDLIPHLEKLLKIVALKALPEAPSSLGVDTPVLDELHETPPGPPIGLEVSYSIVSQQEIDFGRPSSRAGSISMSSSSLPQRLESVSFPLPKGPIPFSGRGGPICRADSCLFLACLPLALSEKQLHIECSKHGVVESIFMWNGPGSGGLGLQHGEAYVCFQTTIP